MPDDTETDPLQTNCCCPSLLADLTPLLAVICPPPNSFTISCDAQYLPPNGLAIPCSSRPVLLSTLCTAEPQGAVLTWYQGVPSTPSVPDTSSPLDPPLLSTGDCPTVAGQDTFFPFITSFNGRTDCQCVKGQTNCYFAAGVTFTGNNAPYTTNPNLVLTAGAAGT